MDIVKSWSVKTASSDSTFTDEISNLSFRDLIELWHPYKCDSYRIIHRDAFRNIIKLTIDYISQIKREGRYGLIYEENHEGIATLCFIYYNEGETKFKIYRKYNWWGSVYEIKQAKKSDPKYIPSQKEVNGCTTLRDVIDKIKDKYTELVISVWCISQK